MCRAGLIDPEDAYPLRQLVLRPYLRVDQVGTAYDRAPGTFHAGVRDGDGRVVAIMSVLRDGVPETGEDAWRIRSMASHPDVRGSGLGGKVLEYGIERALELEVLPIWCNARRAAYGFYERYGFRFVSDEFEIEGIGPHKVMRVDPV
jgi:predicted GNAT family N-acyltransferase